MAWTWTGPESHPAHAPAFHGAEFIGAEFVGEAGGCDPWHELDDWFDDWLEEVAVVFVELGFW